MERHNIVTLRLGKVKGNNCAQGYEIFWGRCWPFIITVGMQTGQMGSCYSRIEFN